MQSVQTVIWVLGAISQNADKSIDWNQPSFPNLNDPDILIVNLDSLRQPLLERIDKDKFGLARNMIFNKFLARSQSTIIYIVSNRNGTHPSYSNLDLSPIQFQIEKVIEGQNIRILHGSDKLTSYFENVKSYSRILYDFSLKYSLVDIEPTNDHAKTIIDKLKLQFSPIKSNTPRHPVELVVNPIVHDNSQNIISSECHLKVDGYWSSGKVIFLPPPTQGNIEEGIDSILREYGKVGKRQSLPSWVSKISLPGLQELQMERDQLEYQRKILDRNLMNNAKRMSNLKDHYRLLSSKNAQLENAVYNAFKLLGFREIRKMRSNGKEDWVINFKALKTYQFGVIEVKGSDKRTGLKDLRQCDNWVLDYLDEFTACAKGIFIPNQYRTRPYPGSVNDRFKFEDNEIQFAISRNICILPSCLLFEIVKRSLKTGQNSRKRIEKTIEGAKGVLENKVF